MRSLLILIIIIVVLTAVAVITGTLDKIKATLPLSSVTNIINSKSSPQDKTLTPQNTQTELGQIDSSLQDDTTQLDKDLQALDQYTQLQDKNDSSSLNNL